MIDIKDVTYSYPGQAPKVVDGLSLRLEDGRIYGLLGENGVGKTTLLGLMCGLLRPKAGVVEADGTDVCLRRPETLASIFYVPDEFELPHVSLSTYVRANAPFYTQFDHSELERSLAEFDMATDIRRLDQLSLGQRKKVMLCFAVASGAKTLLMDEPSNGLDIPSKAQFRKVMASAMTGDRLAVISTHQVHDVEQLLDNVVILDSHSILLNKSIGQLSQEFTFGTLMPGETMPDIIYSEPSIGGLSFMARRQDDAEETQVNMELLFNAVTRGLLNK